MIEHLEIIIIIIIIDIMIIIKWYSQWPWVLCNQQSSTINNCMKPRVTDCTM